MKRIGIVLGERSSRSQWIEKYQSKYNSSQCHPYCPSCMTTSIYIIDAPSLELDRTTMRSHYDFSPKGCGPCRPAKRSMSAKASSSMLCKNLSRFLLKLAFISGVLCRRMVDG